MEVNEGESVTLNTEAEIQSGDQLVWSFGDFKKWPSEDEIILATGENVDNKVTSYKDNERFTDSSEKFKFHLLTGNLNINNISTADSGVYTLHLIRNNTVSFRKFRVLVCGK